VISIDRDTRMTSLPAYAVAPLRSVHRITRKGLNYRSSFGQRQVAAAALRCGTQFGHVCGAVCAQFAGQRVLARSETDRGDMTMFKKIACAMALVAVSTLSAHALETPTSVEQCNALLDEVTAGADPAKLNDDVLNKLDELLTKAENQCEKSEFGDVVKTAEAIQAIMPAPAAGSGTPAATPGATGSAESAPTQKN
jgi:hypothetical protein